MTKRWYTFLALIISLLLIAVAAWSYRAAFSTPYDASYAHDLYDHSQWTIASSVRSIGDELLYQLAGYELVTKWDYFTINPETPPLGKYLYGWAIVWWGNAHLMSLLLFVAMLGLLTYLTFIVFKEPHLRSLALILVVANPLVLEQMSVAMLDLPQLIALLLHVIGILWIKRAKRIVLLATGTMLAGLGLGAFMAIKIGFFVLPILIADCYLLLRTKRLSTLIGIAGISGIFYLSVFLPYFLQGNSLIDFLKAEKWTLKFYLSSQARPFYPAPFTALLFGLNRSWSAGNSWSFIDQWSIIWPLSAFFLYLTLRSWRTISTTTRYITLLSTGLIISSALVPFFARYLLLAMPFFALITAHWYSRRDHPPLFSLFFLLIVAVQTIFFLFPAPQKTTREMAALWEKGAYQDLYQGLTLENTRAFGRDLFWRTGLTLERNIGLLKKTVSIEPVFAFPWQSEVNATVSIVYHTQLGTVTRKIPLKLKREQNQWRIAWNNNYLFNRYTDVAQIRLHHDSAVYGVMKTADGLIKAVPIDRPFISVVPAAIENEEAMQKMITAHTGMKKNDQEVLYKANLPPQWEADIGFIQPSLPESALKKEALDPGIRISLRPYIGMNFNAVRPVQRNQFAQVLDANLWRVAPVKGGTLIVTYRDGSEKTLLQRAPKNGKNITVP